MKKATAKKAAGKKPVGKKAVEKKAVEKKAVEKKAVEKKAAAKKPAAKKGAATSGASPAALIDGRIKELGDWRGKTLARLRALIKEAVPGVVEEWKWRGVPVWYHQGMLFTGESYKDYIKMTFAKGASLKDPSGLFNSSLEGGTRRAIDFREDEKLDEAALKALFKAAAELNASKT